MRSGSCGWRTWSDHPAPGDCALAGGVKYPDVLALETISRPTAYTDRDVMLYALAVGFGADALPFVYERDLQVVPTFNVLLAAGAGSIIARAGFDRTRIVHGEHRLTVHRPLPSAAHVRSRSRCIALTDKGPAKGAVIDIETVVADDTNGAIYSTQVMSLFCRGDGGFGGPVERPLRPHLLPQREADHHIHIAIDPRQALLYRLTGDRTAFHVDPGAARQAGFPQPILHGLCTYGVTCKAIIALFCGGDGNRVASLDVRFSGPIFPGETLALRFWQDGPELSFSATSHERGTPVLDNGKCIIAPGCQSTGITTKDPK